MGTPGHMAHPFDVDRVKTGQDLIDYINDAVLRLQNNEIGGSVKWDGINTSFKLITNDAGKKEFRMDRGTSHIDSVIGLDADAALSKWGPEHGMANAVATLLKIFNAAIPKIRSELKELGMWDDPTKYFNTEYIEGKSNVQEYDQNILAIHGINQFYEKKAQPHAIRKGTSMDRPGLPRPVDPTTNKPIKSGGIEIPYDKSALASLIEKVQLIAQKYGFEVYGDVPVEFDPDVGLNLEKVLNTSVPVQTTPGDVTINTLGEWLQMVEHPQERKVTISANEKKNRKRKIANALSKDIYLAVLNSAQEHGESLSEYLEDPNDIKDAINGGIFYHATRLLGQAVKNVLTSEAGSLRAHEGVVLRGLEDFLVKLTGDFIVQGLASTHGDHPSVTEGLFQNFTIKVSKEREITKTLNNWLREIKEVKHEYQKPPTLVYNDILSGACIIEIVEQDFAQEMIYNTVLRYAAERIVEQEEESVDLHVVDNEDADPVGEEAGGETIALIPGAFKPPTRGHLAMAEEYLNKEQIDRVVILVSQPVKDVSKRNIPGGREVTANDSLEIWKKLAAGYPEDKMSVQPSPMASSFQAALDYIGQAPAGTNVVLGASEKLDAKKIPDWHRWIDTEQYANEGVNVFYGDASREENAGGDFAASIQRHSPHYIKQLTDLHDTDLVQEIPSIKIGKDAGDFHASDMRYLISKALENNDQNAFALLEDFVGGDLDEIDLVRRFSTKKKNTRKIPTAPEEELEENSMSGGAIAGYSIQTPQVVRRTRKKKPKSQKENIDLSMVDDVMRLIMERGILR